jgi:hypothetical protein
MGSFDQRGTAGRDAPISASLVAITKRAGARVGSVHSHESMPSRPGDRKERGSVRGGTGDESERHAKGRRKPLRNLHTQLALSVPRNSL